jgi:hypothetical protein
MARYDIVRACGHEETVHLFGRVKDRESRAEWEATRLCEDCYRAHREKELERARREAQAEAEERGLPELAGSEKQVAWAMTIRQNAMEALDRAERKALDRLAESPDDEQAAFFVATVDAMRRETRAKAWIDEYGRMPKDFVEHHVRDLLRKAWRERPLADPDPEDVDPTRMMDPPERITSTVAAIETRGETIRIVFPENRRDFWEVVKKRLQYRWNKREQVWERKIGYMSGPLEDRLAEAAHELVAAGFSVRAPSPVIEAAIAEAWSAERTRWVVKMKADGRLGIVWDRFRDDDYWRAAKAIPSSRWEAPYMKVQPEQFEAVLDFAEMHDFEISEGAEKAMDKAREERDAAVVAELEAEEAKERKRVGRDPRPMDAPKEVSVDESLRDNN